VRSGKRKLLYAAVAVLLVLSLGLLGTIGAIPLQAQHLNGATSTVANVPPDAALEAPIALFHQGTGFALNESSGEFHLLRVQIVQVRSVQPAEVRELLESEKTVTEIKAELMAQESEQLYKGYLRIDNHNYRLENISVNATTGTDENQTIIVASVRAPPLIPESSETTRVGELTMTTKDYDGGRISKGRLMMHDQVYDKTYQVLLIVLQPQSQPRNVR